MGSTAPGACLTAMRLLVPVFCGWGGRAGPCWITCASPRIIETGGIGALLLSMLLEQEPDLTIFGESELPSHAPDPVMAEHRLGFYARNGAKTAGYETALFGVPYKTLYWSKKPVDDSVLMEQHRHIYESRFSPEKLDRFIRIPYDPAEPLVATPWEE